MTGALLPLIPVDSSDLIHQLDLLDAGLLDKFLDDLLSRMTSVTGDEKTPRLTLGR
jgi:hypothetical protein